MNLFTYERAGQVVDAIRLGRQPETKYLGGGTNLL